MQPYLIHHLLETSAERFPDRDAVVFGTNIVSYADLCRRSLQLAKFLTRLGIIKGDRVGIMIEKSPETIVSIFGILMTGASYVPIDPGTPTNRISYIIQNCAIRVLITTLKGSEKCLADGNQKPNLSKIILTDGDPSSLVCESKNLELINWETVMEPSEDFAPVLIPDTYPAYILHTSGSTGRPKGVVISHLNSLTFVDMAADFFKVNPHDRMANQASVHFDLSVFDLFVAVRQGAAIVLVPETLSMFPVRLAQFIDDNRITVWNSVASVGSMLAAKGQLERFSFNAMRLFLFSGDVMPVKYLRILVDAMCRCRFYNIYGQTEANSSLFYPVEKIPNNDKWKIPIGKPLPNFDVFALDENNEIITHPGQVGELYIEGSTVAMGYWGDPHRTTSQFIQDPRTDHFPRAVFRTGDLVTFNGDVEFIFLGRADHMVKSRGYRIQLDEIEAVLSTHSMIKEAIILAIPDEALGNRLIGAVVPVEGKKPEEVDMKEHCSVHLPPYMIPERINLYDEFPRTSTGKVDRRMLLTKMIKSK